MENIDFWGSKKKLIKDKEISSKFLGNPLEIKKGTMQKTGMFGSIVPPVKQGNPLVIPKQTKLEVGRQVFSGMYPTPKKHTGGWMKDLKADLPKNKSPFNYTKTDKNNLFKINTSNIKSKDIRWTQAQGNSKYNKLNLNPFGDEDKDGLLNMFDCRPLDKKRQEELPIKESKINITIVPPEEAASIRFGKPKQSPEAKAAEEARRKEFRKEQLLKAKIKAGIAKAGYKAIAAKERTKRYIAKQEAKVKSKKLDVSYEKYKSERAKAIMKGDKKQISFDKWKMNREDEERKRKYKLLTTLAKSEAKMPKAKFGTLESLEKTSQQLGFRIDKGKMEATDIFNKVEKSIKAKVALPELKKQYETMAEGPEKENLRKTIASTAKQILSDKELKRLEIDRDYIKSRIDKAKKGEEWAKEKITGKKERALKLEKAGLGWLPGTIDLSKKYLKKGFARYDKATLKQGKEYSKRALGLVGALTSFGGLQQIQARGEDEYGRAMQRAEAEWAQYDRAKAMEQAAAEKKAGRPFGSFKYGMPIQEYKAMMREKEKAARIQEAMAEAAQVQALSSKTQAIISQGITYEDQMPQQQFGQVSVPGVQMPTSPYAALQAGPQYAAIPQISQKSYDTFRRMESDRAGFDMPMKRYPRSYTLSQIRSIPNVYGDMNADPQQAKIPVLPTDQALIREDDLNRQYFADQQQAEIVAAQSEGRYVQDIVKGTDSSLAGSVPMQYAAKVKDLRAPYTKNMILQTQNDGQRKMVPTIKANPWGLQLKNRINFSENNILESDLKGNVVSRDQIGGNILNAPNVFKNESGQAYTPQQTNLSWISNRWAESPTVTGLGQQYSQQQMMQQQMAEQMQTLSPEQQMIMQREMLARQIENNQMREARQPSFYDRLMSGKPLRPKPVSQVKQVKKPSLFDKIKGVVGATSQPVEEQQYSQQSSADEVEINMTQEEFNSLPVEEQQRIIEESQAQQQTTSNQQPRASDEMANYEAQMIAEEQAAIAEDQQMRREADIINNQIAINKARQWQLDHEDTNVAPIRPTNVSQASPILRGFAPGGSRGGVRYG